MKRVPRYGAPVSGLSGSVSTALPSGEAPFVDVPKLIYEVRRVGASLNRTLIVANARGLLELPELRKALSGTGKWKHAS